MTTQYHRITKDTPNPKHDKRCRYGIESVAMFPMGTIILETTRIEKIAGYDIPISFYKIAGKWSIESKKIFDTLPSEHAKPTPEEIYICNYREYASDQFVRAMLREGKLKIEDVEEYFNRTEEESK